MSKPKRTRSRRTSEPPTTFWLLDSPWAVGLIGIAVLLAALGFGYSAFSALFDWQRAQAWEKVEAHIVSGGVEKVPSSRAGTLYRAVARYSYTYKGQAYENTRVRIQGGPDIIGNDPYEMGAWITRAIERHEVVIAFVNPETPEESLLDRDIRWNLFFFDIGFMLFMLAMAAIQGWRLRVMYRDAIAAAQSVRSEPGPDE